MTRLSASKNYGTRIHIMDYESKFLQLFQEKRLNTCQNHRRLNERICTLWFCLNFSSIYMVRMFKTKPPIRNRHHRINQKQLWNQSKYSIQPWFQLRILTAYLSLRFYASGQATTTQGYQGLSNITQFGEHNKNLSKMGYKWLSRRKKHLR